MRGLFAIPILLLLTALAASALAVELTLQALVPVPLSPAQSVALQKVRLGLIGLGSVGALGLGLLLAVMISRLLHRMVSEVRDCLEALGVTSREVLQGSDLTNLSDAFDHLVRAFDKLATDFHILERMPEGVLLVDGQGRIKRANAEARRLLGTAGGSLDGKELTRLLSPEASQVLAHGLWQVRETGTTVELPPVPVPEPGGGGRELSVMLTPFPNGEQDKVLAILKDLGRAVKSDDETRPLDELASAGPQVASLAHKIFARRVKEVAKPAAPAPGHHGEPLEDASKSLAQPSPAKAMVDGSSAPALVDSIIHQALARRASDIHLEPNGEGMRVRFRIDGLLQDVTTISPDDRGAVVSRIKIMANMDIAEHRLPQDGRIRIRQNHHPVDMRVSTVPALYGEKVVLRLLDLQAVAIPLTRIGLSAEHLETLRHLIRKPQGIIFVTGPTGSGKTSTIYACLNDIKSETTNIVTIEDPIEYEMSGVTQIAINEKIDLTFSNILRSVLRQDPDVILVGEVRDLETARIGMQASLTGHMVFSTLHTNDAVGAITRLLDMEIPPYLIASSLSVILAQRLVRVLCPACKTPWEPDAATRSALGLGDGPVVFYRASGCERCYGTGAVGRKGIFELLPITPELSALITSRAAEAELRHAARAAGMRSMFEDGLRKILDGMVAYEELLRVAEPDRPLPARAASGSSGRPARARRPRTKPSPQAHPEGV